MKKPKMGSDPARDLQREKESCWKKSAPKKRTGPPEDDARRKEDPDWERATMSERRPHQHHPEIHCYQKTMELLIQKLPFAYLVWELSQDCQSGNANTESYGWQGSAMQALQEAREYMLVGLLEDANLCLIHMKCIMIQFRDLQLAQQLQGRPSNQ